MIYKIEVYGRYGCPYSEKAADHVKKMFTNRKIDDIVIYMQQTVDNIIREKQRMWPQTKTVPVIFVTKKKGSNASKLPDGYSELKLL